MQFKAIIVLALAAAVSAVPAGDLEARTGSSCGSGLTNSCCNSLQKLNIIGVAIPISLGVNCVANSEYPNTTGISASTDYLNSSWHHMHQPSHLLPEFLHDPGKLQQSLLQRIMLNQNQSGLVNIGGFNICGLQVAA